MDLSYEIREATKTPTIINTFVYRYSSSTVTDYYDPEIITIMQEEMPYHPIIAIQEYQTAIIEIRKIFREHYKEYIWQSNQLKGVL
jgi:hypothetical protein